jgi:hypothetical protein
VNRRILFITFYLLAITLALIGKPSFGVNAQNVNANHQADLPLCLPNDEQLVNEDCLAQGPAGALQTLAEKGINFPQKPIYASYTPYDLSYVPFNYAKVKEEEVPLYATLEDVEKRKPTNHLAAGRIKYVSVSNRTETNKGVFYQIATTEWISADDVSRVGAPNFQGYLFKENPDFTFGWIINETTSRSAPGYDAPETQHKYWRMDPVHFYDSRVINDVEWVMIGAGQWVEHRNTARVIPNYATPQGVTGDRWIEVNLYEQVLTVYENGKLLFATLISTGVDPFFTQPGVFQVTEKLEHDVMYGAFEADRSDYYYLEEVPYIMYYDQRRALHGAYWQSLLGYQRSHGCVNLSVADAHWLYDWANVGEFVYVWDPSGKTPTDPAFYGSGGF